MQFILTLLSGLLVPLLFSLTVTIIAALTLFNAKFVSRHIEASGFYSTTSTLASSYLQKSSEGAISSARAEELVTRVLSPTVMQEKSEQLLKDSELYLSGKGDAPDLPIEDILVQAQAAGLPLEAADIPKTLTLPDEAAAQSQAVITRYQGIRRSASYTTIALFAIFVLASIMSRHYVRLILVLTTVAILCVVAFFASGPLTESLQQQIVFTEGDLVALQTPLITLTRGLVGDLANHFAYAAVLFAAAAGLVAGVAMISKARHAPAKKALVAKST